jgi:hypothetical protein
MLPPRIRLFSGCAMEKTVLFHGLFALEQVLYQFGGESID